MTIGFANSSDQRKKDSARLVWDTKPKRAPNPKDIEFQTAEIVVPNPQRDQTLLPSYAHSLTHVEINKTKMNRIIWGDNLLAMQALLASGYEGKIKLIYIDPPFWTGENYYAQIKIAGREVTTSPPVIQRLAYKDIWSGGIDSYLDMMYPRLQLMKRLLTDDGSLFIHLDWHLGHYIKAVLDEIFGKKNFRNEITVRRTAKHTAMQFEKAKTLQVASDSIFIYAKSEVTEFNKPYKEASEKQKAGSWHGFTDNCYRPTMRYKLFGLLPPSPRGRWLWKESRAQQAAENYKLFEIAMTRKTVRSFEEFALKNPDLEFVRFNNGSPQYWILATEQIMADSSWLDIQAYSHQFDYPTEKSKALLERVIKMASDKNDLVFDCFAGSGTTLAIAEELERRWIGCDFSKTAIQIIRNRLVTSGAKPFLLENIGNYQRQLIYLSGIRIYEMQKIVLKLYGATPRKDLPDMGTRRASDEVIELIYVSYPDRPVTAKKAEELAYFADRLDGVGYKRLVILGWDYEYNYEELLKERRRASKDKWKTDVSSRTIPPEVYDYLKTAKTEGEVESLQDKVHFHEKPYLKMSVPRIEKMKNGKAKVTIGIERYVVFDYPIEDEKKRQEVMEIAQKDIFLLVDYWAIDWDYDNFTFKSVWQAVRNGQSEVKEIPKTASKELEPGKTIEVAVRLVDVFGNDSSATQVIDLRKL